MERRARVRVVEVSPRLEYLAEVAREIRLHFRIAENKDPFLDRVYSQIRLRHVRGAAAICSFRFDREGGRHHRGDEYEYLVEGKLRIRHVSQSVRSALRRLAPEPSVHEVALPGPDDLTAEGLLGAVDLLIVQQVLSA